MGLNGFGTMEYASPQALFGCITSRDQGSAVKVYRYGHLYRLQVEGT